MPRHFTARLRLTGAVALQNSLSLNWIFTEWYWIDLWICSYKFQSLIYPDQRFGTRYHFSSFQIAINHKALIIHLQIFTNACTDKCPRHVRSVPIAGMMLQRRECLAPVKTCRRHI